LSFFGRRRKDAAQREYGRFIGEAFSEELPSPWRNLKHGLVIGGEAFVKRVRGLMGKKKPARKKAPPVKKRPEKTEARRKAAKALAATVSDPRLQTWVRVALGGERGIDVARAQGYKDGSAITHMLKRLQAHAAEDASLRRQIAKLQREFDRKVSGGKS
jgi:hypothetical protein